jgi:hypothetical protein
MESKPKRFADVLTPDQFAEQFQQVNINRLSA